MKKVMLCIILCLFIFFSACSNEVDNTKIAGDHALFNENTAETSSEYEAEYPLLSINSAEEYNKFLNEKSDIPNFIAYNMFQEIGTFERITFLSNAKVGDYSHYMYELCDTSGYTLYLYVKAGDTQKDEGKALKEEQIDPHNLRKLQDKSNGTYVCNGYEYQYINGELLSIHWKNEAISFVLSGDSMLSDYPQNEKTILSSLLSVDTSSTTKALLHTILPE